MCGAISLTIWGVFTIGAASADGTQRASTTPSSTAMPVQLLSIPLMSGGALVAIDGDGRIWANHREDGLICFDGMEWSRVHTELHPPISRSKYIAAMLPGADGAMLLLADWRMVLLQNGKVIASGAACQVLEDQIAFIRRVYGPGAPTRFVPRPPRAGCAVIADKSGNVWYLRGNRLVVWCGGRWHNARESLERAGGSGDAADIRLIGDGSRVYVDDRCGRGTHPCFVGRMEEKAFHFEPAPGWPARVSCVLHDRERALWVPADFSPEDTERENSSCRVTATGVEPWKGRGAPQLAEESGSVWLGPSSRPASGRFSVWRDGQIVQELRVLGITVAGVRDWVYLFSDAPGSVYAWTSAGLQHRVADGPDFTHYRLGEVHLLPDVGEIEIFCGYSGLGYAAGIGRRESRETLFLIALPRAVRLENQP